MFDLLSIRYENPAVCYRVCDRTLWEFKEGIEERNARDPDRRLNMVEQLLLDQELSHQDIVTFMTDLLPGGSETVSLLEDFVFFISYFIIPCGEEAVRRSGCF